ncbi:hypothetical protein [Gordonia sp. FQ]|uniref:hypothetical protein n=1 Tax=Gordonia sp. FQ TaxID=3446634 RepID=UPI003F8465DA
MKVSTGTGRIPGTTILDPVYRVTDWYGDPARGSLAYDEFVVTETLGISEVVDWIASRHEQALLDTRSSDSLHSTELWLLTPPEGSSSRLPVQTLLGTFYVAGNGPLVGTHSICESDAWRNRDNPAEDTVDPTQWQAELALEFERHELTVRTAAIVEAVRRGLPYSTSMRREDSATLQELTRLALQQGAASLY